MPLNLITSKSDLEWFPIYFDRDSNSQGPWPTNGDGNPIGKEDKDPIELDEDGYPTDESLGVEVAFFGLKLLSSGDMIRISNKVYSMNRRGKSSFEYGTAAQEKVLASCKQCKNVGGTSDSKAEIPFNKNIFDGLPQWVSDKLTDEINERNNLSTDEEQD